jgi:hypothetical protein
MKTFSWNVLLYLLGPGAENGTYYYIYKANINERLRREHFQPDIIISSHM